MFFASPPVIRCPSASRVAFVAAWALLARLDSRTPLDGLDELVFAWLW
jgi:hypothetical protein